MRFSLFHVIRKIQPKMASLAKGNEILFRAIHLVVVDVVDGEDDFSFLRTMLIRKLPRIPSALVTIDDNTVRGIAQFTPVPRIGNYLPRQPLPIFGIFLVVTWHLFPPHATSNSSYFLLSTWSSG